MNITEISSWGQLISSTAVLVTLAYLAIQTKQTATLLRSESRQSLIDADISILNNILLEHPDVWLSRFGEGDLTMNQKIQLHGALLTFLRSREHYWTQFKNGVLDEET